MKKIPKWIALKYDESPNQLWCRRCGEKREMHLPASIDDAIKQGEAFAESHKFCKEKKCPTT